MQNLKPIRELRGLDEGDVARAVKCKRFEIVAYEAGKHVPLVSRAAKIADVLEVSLDELVGRDTHNTEGDEPIGYGSMVDFGRGYRA